MSGHRRDDRGSGTVLALAVIGVVLVVVAGLGLLAGAQSARGQAQAAADLAALAGATRLMDGAADGSGGGAAVAGSSSSTGSAGAGSVDSRSACATAAEAARRNGAELTSCVPGAGSVLDVATSRRSAAGEATARARAGPRSAR